ncbi:MAG: hypothetical protein ACREQ5_12770, partial [Candidatus Dormibacteria bacterium]
VGGECHEAVTLFVSRRYTFMNGGDQLARGAKSAQFPASNGQVAQERWDAIFGPKETAVVVAPPPKKA